jgi:hypothetical protein
MRCPVRLVFVLVLVFIMGTVGCAGLMSSRVDLTDLPETQYVATRYRSATRSLAIILDDPSDDVVLSVDIDKVRTKKEGLSTPQRYLNKFLGPPEAYQLQDKESGDVLGYLLISPHLKWLVHYNRGKGSVTFSIEDPLAGGGNGGE